VQVSDELRVIAEGGVTPMRITGRAARGPLVATVELSLCHDAASEAADSSKPGFHRQMISIAAAITIPVTNPVWKHSRKPSSVI
jgi:hypothetical protein